jgi:serine/threonine protein kinase
MHVGEGAMDPASLKKLYQWFDRLIELPIEEEAKELRKLREEHEPIVLHLECLLASARKHTNTSTAFGIDDLIDAAQQSDQSDSLSDGIDQLSKELRFDPVHQMNRVGDFLLIRCLSVSKLGITYYAHDSVLDREVALLLAMPKWRATPLLRSRLVESARIVAKLFHPNVASILGTMDVDQQFIILRQWIPGISLQEALMQNGPMTPKQSVELAIGICEGLQALHQAEVLHGDLKPANIILREPSRTPVITDFGTSLWLGASHNPSWKGGTPGYIAPEILRGEESTKGADLFSLGVVLYQLIHPEALSYESIPSQSGPSHSGPSQSRSSHSGRWKRSTGDVDPMRERYEQLVDSLVAENVSSRPAGIEVVLKELREISSLYSKPSGAVGVTEFESVPTQESRLNRSTRRAWIGRTMQYGLMGASSTALGYLATKVWNSESTVVSPYVPGIETKHKLFFPWDDNGSMVDQAKRHKFASSELFDINYLGVAPTSSKRWLHLDTTPLTLPSFEVKANLVMIVVRFDLPPRQGMVRLAYSYEGETRWTQILQATNAFGGLYYKAYHLSIPNAKYRPSASIRYRVSLYDQSDASKRNGVVPLCVNTDQKQTQGAMVQLRLWDRLMYKTDRSDQVNV